MFVAQQGPISPDPPGAVWVVGLVLVVLFCWLMAWVWDEL
jgi:hypothetical protein